MKKKNNHPVLLGDAHYQALLIVAAKRQLTCGNKVSLAQLIREAVDKLLANSK